MLRINRLTDYGTLALTYLAMHPERMHSAADVAAELDAKRAIRQGIEVAAGIG